MSSTKITTDWRTLKVVNDPEDLVLLHNDGFNLQVAKSVIKDGKLIFNIVWKSKVLAPVMTVKSKPVYGMNWTTDVPTEGGIEVTLGGIWAPCDKGQILDLDEYGLWTRSQKAAVPDFIAVGQNRYKSGTPSNGVHIVIGTQSPSGDWETIFVDPVSLGPLMKASYQPQEKLQWWYEQGMKTATMISSDVSDYATGDFSARNPQGTYSMTSSYDYSEGTWKTSTP